MVATRITNKSINPATLPAQLGGQVLGGNQGVVYDATAAQLLQAIPSLEYGFEITEFPDQIGAPPLPGGVPMLSPASALTRGVYVSTSGSDTTGDGSFQRPWATVPHALKQVPQEFVGLTNATTTLCYQIRVIAPYTAPIGTWTIPAAVVRGPGFTRALVQVIAWPADEVFGATNDPRWSYLLGPVTSTAAAQYSGNRLLYTLPAATLSTNDQHVGEFVRIFNAGVEVCRGWIFRSVAGATQQIYVHTRQTFTAQVTDQIYVCRPTVVFGTPGSSQLLGLEGEAPAASRFMFELNTCRTIDTINVAGSLILRGSNTQFIANGGGGAITTTGGGAQVDGTHTLIATMPTAEQTLAQAPCFMRSTAGTGFLGGGNIFLGSGVWLGQYRALSGGWPIFNLSIGTFRGDVLVSNIPTQIQTFATTTSPLLIIPTGTQPTFVLTCASTFIQSETGFIAVETSLSAGDLFRIRGGSRLFLPGTVRPVTPATAMAAGIVIALTDNSSALINAAAATIAGAGGVDYQSGANSPRTWAQLLALVPTRDTDPVALTQVYNGTTL